MRVPTAAIVIITVGSLLASPHAPSATASGSRLDFGALVVTLSTSRTAQLFHIVDQLADWNPYAHRAYLRWAAKSFVLDDDDRKALARQAVMRKAPSKPEGFEHAFLVDETLADAAAAAVRAKWVTPEEASDEVAILSRFASRVGVLIDQHDAELDAFAASLVHERERLRPIVKRIATFAGATTPLSVPVFLVANPEATSGGGEANANRLIVEVPAPDSRGTLLHESLHAFLRPHADEIGAAAASAGLTMTELNEGIAYALSPGLTDEPGVNRLAGQLDRFVTQGRPKTDPYVRFYTIATVLRPVLSESLDRGDTIAMFLPKATAAWKAAGK